MPSAISVIPSVVERSLFRRAGHYKAIPTVTVDSTGVPCPAYELQREPKQPARGS